MNTKLSQTIANQQETHAKLFGNQVRISRAEILRDYSIISQSRQTSIAGRREVMTGKAKFGIFGDGIELPQIAMAKDFQKGDFRSGY